MKEIGPNEKLITIADSREYEVSLFWSRASLCADPLKMAPVLFSLGGGVATLILLLGSLW
jgi:hypothetical protein